MIPFAKKARSVIEKSVKKKKRGGFILGLPFHLAVVTVCWIGATRVERYRSLVQDRWEYRDVLWGRCCPVVWCYPVDSDEALYDADLCQTDNRTRSRAAYAMLPDSTT